jgi:hypothetical protein
MNGEKNINMDPKTYQSSASIRMKTIIRITQKKYPDFIWFDPDFIQVK